MATGKTIRAQDILDPFDGERENYANKEELSDKAKGLVFDITSIEYERNKGSQSELDRRKGALPPDRWKVGIVVHYSETKSEEQILSFNANEKRDAEMEKAQKYLEKNYMTGYVLVRSGNAYYINKSKSVSEKEIPF